MGRIMSWSRTGLFAALLGASLLGTTANAQVYGGCGERVRRAEIRLQEAIRRHGPNSRAAYERRRELARARASCRLGPGYWR
jgi:hypothetical protein